MPLNEQARFLSNDYLAKGLLENFPNRLQFLTALPFFPIPGNSLTYVRTPALSFADIIGFCDPIAEHTKLPEEPVNFPMAELATHFEVSYKAQDIFCETNDQAAVQHALAIRQLLYRFSEQLQGDGFSGPYHENIPSGEYQPHPERRASLSATGVDPITFKGLKQLVHPSKVIDLNCQPLTIQHLDQAKGMVRTNNGYAGVIITNQLGYEFIRKTHYLMGINPDSEIISVPDPMNGSRLQKVTSFDGWVVYINDKQPVIECETAAVKGEKNQLKPKKGASPRIMEYNELANPPGGIPPYATNIWFAVLGWNYLHGIIPDCLGESMFVSRTTIRPDNSKIVSHVTWPVGLALGSQCALSGILNVTHP